MGKSATNTSSALIEDRECTAQSRVDAQDQAHGSTLSTKRALESSPELKSFLGKEFRLPRPRLRGSGYSFATIIVR
jgi:hypothetical protein